MSDRRNFLIAAGSAGIAAGGFSWPRPGQRVAAPLPESPVGFALNTSTIRGQKLTIEKQIEIASKAGYDGIEPWIRDIRDYQDRGGKLPELGKLISESGLNVVSAIGFAKWISNDEQTRRDGLLEARRDMELVRAIGGRRIAAPPAGAGPKNETPSLDAIAQRYRTLLELGTEIGVIPQLELWGHSHAISKLHQLAYIATAAGHPQACVLPDFFHIYKGGNEFAGLGMIEASRMDCFHINDYPAKPDQTKISDRDRVFPGDGVCPLPQVIRQLIDNGFCGTFSLELFNPTYWKRDALEVAIEGLNKSKSVVRMAMELDPQKKEKTIR